jgi:tetratricopeptide (TPR) repeat protein
MTEDKDYDRAVELHMESLALRRQLGDKAGIARTLQNLGHVKMSQGKWSEASSLTEEAHAIYREMDSPAVAYTLYVLAMIAAEQDDLGLAQARFEECLDTSRKSRYDWLTAWTLQGLGSLLYRRQEYEHATRTFTDAHVMFVQLGDSLGTAHALVSLAREAQRVSDYQEAARLYNQALAVGHELDNKGLIGGCLAGFAGLVAQKGQARKAATLFGSAEKVFGQFSTSLQREQMTLGLDEAKATLGPAEWEAAWAEGEAITIEDALALALSL